MNDANSYEERLKQFDWSIAEKELGWRRGDPINIGWYCSDRICQLGSAAKPALIWEGGHGRDAHLHLRRPARALEHHRGLPAAAGAQARRAHLPVHGPHPRALHRLPRRPQDGRHRPAAVLGLRRRVAAHAARQCADRGHPHAAQARGQDAQDPRLAARPAAHHRRGRGRGPAAAGRARSPLALDQEPRVESFEVYPSTRRDALGAALHLGHHRPAQGRAARALLADLAVPDQQVGARPAAGRRLLVQRRSRLGHRHLLRHHRPLGQRRHPGRARLGLHRRALVRLHRRSTASPSGTPPPPPSAC